MLLNTRTMILSEMYPLSICERLIKEYDYLPIVKYAFSLELQVIEAKEWFRIEAELDKVLFADKERSPSYLKINKEV